MTKDLVSVRVEAVASFRVSRPMDCVRKVVDARAATRLVVQGAVRQVAGSLLLADLFVGLEETGSTMLVGGLGGRERYSTGPGKCTLLAMGCHGGKD